MKRTIVVMFLSVFMLALIAAGVISVRSMELTRKYNQEQQVRENRIKINDVLKSAEQYIRIGEVDKLNRVVHKYGYEISLYEPNGKIIFSSNGARQQESGNYGNGSNGNGSNSNADDSDSSYEINSLLEAANKDKQIYMLGFKNENTNGNGNANKNVTSSKNVNANVLAIIDTHVQEPNINAFRNDLLTYMWVFCFLLAFVLALALVLINREILVPFKQLEHFTTEVAKGNLELPLERNKRNPFGAFTWAFDLLRTELKHARVREQQLEKSKKELVAVLSHDIRTPIAAIRAYGEYISGLTDKNTERCQTYIKVIIEKSDELARLSQDMFLHAISDLERLEVNAIPMDSRELLIKVIEPLMLQFDHRIIIKGEFPKVQVLADANRLAQVVENIVSNAVKYAPESDIEITTFVDKDMLHCAFRDFGEGVKPEDIPFLFDKFYRGKNAKERAIQGTGIGLYIAKYIMEKCSGTIKAKNAYEVCVSDAQVSEDKLGNSSNGRESGLVVELGFRLG